MIAMCRRTGKAISGVEAIEQSINDIVSTSVGSRLLSRDYGSNLRDIVDSPMSATYAQQLRAKVASAITREEPRVTLSAINIHVELAGEQTVTLITVECVEKETNNPITIEAQT